MQKTNILAKYRTSLSIALIYMVASAVYIIVSDRIVYQIFGDSSSAEIFTTIQSYKGLGFVLVTSLLLFGLAQWGVNSRRKHIMDLENQKEELEKQTRKTNKAVHDLGERIKELKCLYTASRLIEDTDAPIEKVLQGITDAIPTGWHYPEITTARIKFNNREYTTQNFQESKWRQDTDILVDKENLGKIEVFYLKEKPIRDKGPFMKEEQNLIETLAVFIGEFYKRRTYFNELKTTNRRLEIEIEERSKAYEELGKQTRKSEEIQIELTKRSFFIETILKNLPLGIAVNRIDDGSCTFINNKFADIYGWPEEELTDVQRFFEKVYPDAEYRNEIFKRITQDIESREQQRMLWSGVEITRKDGQKRIVEARNIPVFEQNLMISTVSDITEEKEAEQKIKDGEEKYRAIFENSLTAIMIADDEGNYISANKAAETLFGYPVNKLIKMNVRDLKTTVSPDATTRYETYVKKGREIGEFDFIDKNGVKHVALYHAVRVAENFNLSVLMDITELKSLQNELKETNVRLNGIANNLPGAVIQYRLDPSGSDQLLYASEGASTIFGVPVDTALGDMQMIWQQIDPRDIADVQRSIEISANELSQWNTEFRSNLPDESIKWLQGIGKPRHTSDGSIIWDSIILDITSRKMAEDQLRINEEIFRLIAENTMDIISVHDKHLKFQYISPSVKSARGYDPEELIGKSAYDYFHPEDKSYVKQNLPIGLKQSKKLKYRIKSKNNSYNWFESHSQAVLDENNRLVNIVSIARDISKRVVKEKEIESYQKSLQRLTTEISLVEERQRKEIAANIHDNLSQLLVVSKMKLSQLQDEIMSNGSKGKIDSIINHVSEALENSRKITYDLSPPVLYEFGLIRTINWLAGKIEKEHGIKFIFETEIDELNLSESKLILTYRIIQELVMNCVKHASASMLRVELKRRKTGLEILISDDGKGFELNEVLSKSYVKGGFGLFAVRERINNLNGKLNIDSKVGKGTEIAIYIPNK